MDVITGSTVEGAYQGTITGDNVGLVKGKVDQALQVQSDSYVTFGQRQSECYHNVDMCDTGLTYAMWIWLAHNHANFRVMMIHSGGATVQSKGIALKYNENTQSLIIRIQSSLTYHNFHSKVDTGIWFHLAFTWSEEDSVRGYINGCLVDKTPSVSARSTSVSKSFPFTIGQTPVINEPSANMNIDELQIWYELLSAEQVWAIYIHS